jgi:hypothetical protein
VRAGRPAPRSRLEGNRADRGAGAEDQTEIAHAVGTHRHRGRPGLLGRVEGEQAALRLEQGDRLRGGQPGRPPVLEEVGGAGRVRRLSTGSNSPSRTRTVAGVDPIRSPALATAARWALDARGERTTGWALASRIALRARLRDAAVTHAWVRASWSRRRATPRACTRTCSAPTRRSRSTATRASPPASPRCCCSRTRAPGDLTRLRRLAALPAAWSTGSTSEVDPQEFGGISRRHRTKPEVLSALS